MYNMAKKDRLVYLNIFVLIIFWIIASFNYNNPDYIGYKTAYDNGQYVFEPIFNMLMLFFKSFCINYQGFLAIIFIAISTIYYLFIKKYTNNVWIVLVCVIFSPLGLLMTQVRCFIAYAIIQFALTYFLFNIDNANQTKQSVIIKYIALIILASGIQRTSIFFIFLVFIPFLKTKLIIIASTIWFVVIAILFTNDSLFSSILHFFDFIIPYEKTYFYLITDHIRPNFNAVIATFSLYFSFFIFVLISLYIRYKDKCSLGVAVNYIEYIQSNCNLEYTLIKCYLFVSFILPFCLKDTTFERFYFYLFPIAYAVIIRQADFISKHKYKKYIYLLMLLSVIFAIFYMVEINGLLYRIIIPMYIDNYFIKAILEFLTLY